MSEWYVRYVSEGQVSQVRTGQVRSGQVRTGQVILFHGASLLQSSIKALYKRGFTFSRSWLVENLDGGMCNPFLTI